MIMNLGSYSYTCDLVPVYTIVHIHHLYYAKAFPERQAKGKTQMSLAEARL